MPRPARLALFALALVAVALGPLVAATDAIPAAAHRWIALALSVLIALREALPALWARYAAEPERVAEVVRPAVALLALGLSGCEVREGYGLMISVAIAAPVVVLMAGVLLGLGRRGPLVLAALLLALPARADEPAPVPMVQLAPVVQPAPVLPPVVAPLPTVPPAALSPCEVCAGQVGAAIGKPPQTWPTWAKVLVGVAGAAFAGWQIARDAGAVPGVR